MQVPTISKSPELVALLKADPDYALRYEACLIDIGAAKSTEELNRTSSFGNGWTSYIKEWNSHHGMLQRAAKKNILLSPELRHFPAFLVHVGPKPHYETVSKLSIDKTNSKGYLINEIRWEGPAHQTHNRSSSKFHLYKGRYYTDNQLAEALTELSGHAVKGDTVKKRRHRGKNTPAQFAVEGVPYESGLDPISDWDFPANCATKLNILYRKYHRRGETRLAFFVRWLRTQELPHLEALMINQAVKGEQHTRIWQIQYMTKSSLHAAQETLKKLEEQKVAKEISDAVYSGVSYFDFE